MMPVSLSLKSRASADTIQELGSIKDKSVKSHSDVDELRCEKRDRGYSGVPSSVPPPTHCVPTLFGLRLDW
eukprot:scaffold8710_cov53-Cyclotella_meneghiniana.AAC.4